MRCFGFAVLATAASLSLVPENGYAKTAKECDQEYAASKAEIQASGEKKKDFVTRCRADTAAVTAPLSTSKVPQKAPAEPQAPTAAPAQNEKPVAPAESPAQAEKPVAPAETPAQAEKPKAPAARASKRALTKAGQFASEAEAKAHCPSDTVVWANTKSRIYHFAGHPDYGRTKAGAYMCQGEAAAGGIRAAKNEKHP